MSMLIEEREQSEGNENGQEIIDNVFQDSNHRLGTRMNMQMRLCCNFQNFSLLQKILIVILLTTAAVSVGLLVIRNKPQFSIADHCLVSERCQNGGTCVNGQSNYSCTCVEEFAGNHCESNLCNNNFNQNKDANECGYPGRCTPPSDQGNCHRCRLGFIKDPKDDTRCKYANGNASLIVSSQQDIRVISLDGLNTTQVIKNEGVVFERFGIDYSFRTNAIFWFNINDRKINTAPINSDEGKKIVFHDSSSVIFGIAVDWIHHHLYWVDKGKKQITVANFNGTMKKVLFNDGLLWPTSIAVNPINGWMYWSDETAHHIERAGLDGSRREVILSTNIKDPYGLVVDFVNNRLLWSHGESPSSIWSCEFDGSDPKIIFSPNLPQLTHSFFCEISTFDKFVYFIEFNSKAIYKVNKCNGEELTLVYKSEYFLEDFKIYDATLQPEGKNLCSERTGQCSHFCFPVPSPGNGSVPTSTCACPDGLTLFADQQTCA